MSTAATGAHPAPAGRRAGTRRRAVARGLAVLSLLTVALVAAARLGAVRGGVAFTCIAVATAAAFGYSMALVVVVVDRPPRRVVLTVLAAGASLPAAALVSSLDHPLSDAAAAAAWIDVCVLAWCITRRLTTAALEAAKRAVDKQRELAGKAPLDEVVAAWYHHASPTERATGIVVATGLLWVVAARVIAPGWQSAPDSLGFAAAVGLDAVWSLDRLVEAAVAAAGVTFLIERARRLDDRPSTQPDTQPLAIEAPLADAAEPHQQRSRHGNR